MIALFQCSYKVFGKILAAVFCVDMFLQGLALRGGVFGKVFIKVLGEVFAEVFVNVFELYTERERETGA